MYAVIETGGKQYRVEVGTELEVELLDVEPGKTITIDRVLLVADGDDSTIGQPVVADASVSAEVVSQKRGPKLISFKYRPKARRRVKKGHRQELTLLRVADITLNGKSAAKERKQADDAAAIERTRAEEAAAARAAKDAELAEKLAVGAATAPKKAPRAKAETAAEKPARAEKAETTAEKPATSETDETPAKAEAAEKADATAKPAKAEAAEKPARAAKAEPTEKPAKAAKAGAAEKPATKSTAKAKADTGASDDETAKPKRSRTTKKDE
jgi:large subunit ribosomal protein L21